VLITDTALTAPADPGSFRDIAVKAFMAGISFRCWPPSFRAWHTQAAAASQLRQ
jgi:hypothetical protein